MSSTRGQVLVRCFGADFETSHLEDTSMPRPNEGDTVDLFGAPLIVKSVADDDGSWLAEAWVITENAPRDGKQG